MVTLDQSAANWRNTHTHVDRMHSLTHLHHHSYNHVVQSASSTITEFRINLFILKVPEGVLANWSTWRKPPDSLPGNWHHILEEKIKSPGRELNCHPPTWMISSPGQECAPHLTHWATDRAMRRSGLNQLSTSSALHIHNILRIQTEQNFAIVVVNSCVLCQFTALWAMVTMGTVPIKVLHYYYCCSVPQMNTLRITQYVHPNPYMYKYSSLGERICVCDRFQWLHHVGSHTLSSEEEQNKNTNMKQRQKKTIHHVQDFPVCITVSSAKEHNAEVEKPDSPCWWFSCLHYRFLSQRTQTWCSRGRKTWLTV